MHGAHRRESVKKYTLGVEWHILSVTVASHLSLYVFKKIAIISVVPVNLRYIAFQTESLAPDAPDTFIKFVHKQ